MMVRKRTKMLATIFFISTVALFISMFMSLAYATTPVQVTWTSAATGLIVQDGALAGKSDNRFLDLSLTAVCAGDIAGSYTSDSHWIIRNWISGVSLLKQPGPVYVHAIDYFTATYDGKSGTLAILVNHIYYPSIGSSEGTWVIISGTGDLENLHGQGTTFDPPGPSSTTWTGQVHFDP